MIVPFKNIINAIYSKDIGRKVKSSFALMMKKGEFLGPHAPLDFYLMKIESLSLTTRLQKISKEFLKCMQAVNRCLAYARLLPRKA